MKTTIEYIRFYFTCCTGITGSPKVYCLDRDLNERILKYEIKDSVFKDYTFLTILKDFDLECNNDDPNDSSFYIENWIERKILSIPGNSVIANRLLKVHWEVRVDHVDIPINLNNTTPTDMSDMLDAMV